MDKLINKYLKRYMDGFKTKDITALRADCAEAGISYTSVMEKLSYLEYIYK